LAKPQNRGGICAVSRKKQTATCGRQGDDAIDAFVLHDRNFAYVRAPVLQFSSAKNFEHHVQDNTARVVCKSLGKLKKPQFAEW